MPASSMNASSGGSRLRAPSSVTSFGSTSPASISIRNGMPQALPDGDDAGVLRSPCASIQTTADPAVTACELAHRTDVRAAAAAENERAVGQLTRRRRESARRASPRRRPRPRATAAPCSRQRPSARRRRPTRAARARGRPQNSRPHEWHWYSGPIATAVSVRQSGQRARSALTARAPSCRSAGSVACRRARRVAAHRSRSRCRHRGRPAATAACEELGERRAQQRLAEPAAAPRGPHAERADPAELGIADALGSREHEAGELVAVPASSHSDGS